MTHDYRSSSCYCGCSLQHIVALICTSLHKCESRDRERESPIYILIVFVYDLRCYMATSFVREDDETANIVLRDMHKELLSQINVDEITVHLISAGMITDPQRDALQNDRCTASSRNTFLLSNVLGGKGYWGLKTLLAALKGNKLYQPHIELASKIEEEYCKRLQRSSSFVQPVSQPGSFVSLQRQQQAPDPRTGESPPSTMSPTGSQYCLQFSQPGSYNVKVNYLSDGSESFQSQSVGRHRNRKVSDHPYDLFCKFL